MARTGCCRARWRGGARFGVVAVGAAISLTLSAAREGVAASVGRSSPAGRAVRQDELKVPSGVVGKPLPGAAAQTYGEKLVNTASFKGKPTLITFWATWCGPCLKEMPTFQKAIDESKGKLRVVAIAMQDQWDNAEGFARQHPEYKFLFLHDPDWEADQSRLSKAFGVTALPTNVFVDAGGIVRDYWRGSKNEEELLDRLRRLLDGS
ncbi:MAG: TlpA family protein disulfide reductase [Vicinamibacterales bacterium]